MEENEMGENEIKKEPSELLNILKQYKDGKIGDEEAEILIKDYYRSLTVDHYLSKSEEDAILDTEVPPTLEDKIKETQPTPTTPSTETKTYEERVLSKIYKTSIFERIYDIICQIFSPTERYIINVNRTPNYFEEPEFFEEAKQIVTKPASTDDIEKARACVYVALGEPYADYKQTLETFKYLLRIAHPSNKPYLREVIVKEKLAMQAEKEIAERVNFLERYL